jgi:hypothetical protein
MIQAAREWWGKNDGAVPAGGMGRKPQRIAL